MFVRTVGPQLRDASRPHADDKSSWQLVQLKEVPELIAGVDLGDPGVVLVPLARDPMRGGAKLAEELTQELTDGRGPFGPTAVGDQHPRIGRHQRDCGLQVESIDRVEELFDRRLAHSREV